MGAEEYLDYCYPNFNGFKYPKGVNDEEYPESPSSDDSFNVDEDINGDEEGFSPDSYNALEGIQYWCEDAFFKDFEKELFNYRNSKIISYSIEFLLTLRSRNTKRPVFLSCRFPQDLLKDNHSGW